MQAGAYRSPPIGGMQVKRHIYRVRSFKIAGPFKLTVAFDDGSEQAIDFLPVLRGEMFGPLRDRSLFEAVRLDPESCTLVWPNGADFDPATLHDWPECGPDLADRAQQWEATESRACAVAEGKSEYGTVKTKKAPPHQDANCR